MINLIHVVLVSFIVTFVSTITFCPKGCKCKASGNCYECETGYYLQDGDCKRCSPNCMTCSSVNICKKCENGYFTYNVNLNHLFCRPCSTGCTECTSETNCTKCKVGYFDSVRQCRSCPKNCHNAKCNQHYGTCDHGCTPGYWGQFCVDICPNDCLNGGCYHENGTCILGCRDGYNGNMCDCPNSCICNSSGQCLLSCLNLKDDDEQRGNQFNSVCLKCSLDTEKCERCGNDTFYGQFCDKECSNTCIDRRCDTLTGRCTSGCMIGYFGDNCTKQCNCRKLPCNRETGLCNIAEETDADHILLKCADINVILMTCVAVLVIYAIVTTVVLMRKRNLRRRQLDINVTSREHAENRYQPTAHRNAANLEHMYAVPDVTSSRSVPLVNMETRSSNSAEDRDMYIHPIYVETTVRHEYEEVT